jgi:hypothetical protein
LWLLDRHAAARLAMTKKDMDKPKIIPIRAASGGGG